MSKKLDDMVRLECELIHQRELVRVLAERWSNAIYGNSDYTDESIAWAEAQVKKQEVKP